MTVVEDLVRLIEEVSGNVVPDRDHDRLEAIAQERAREAACKDLESYIKLLKRDQDGAEWRGLLSRITVNESYLFRAPQQFAALAATVIPDLVKRRTSRLLRVWSAGCARGEEAATLAVVLSESPHLAGWDWSILASDVDETTLAQARKGIYGRRAVANVPTDLLERYFEPRSGHFELQPRLRRRIEYRSLNLVREALQIPPSSFDLIFFRNVLIYFRPSSQQRVTRAVAATMADDGYLFLGTSESLWQLCPELEPVDLGSCFCYRRNPERERLIAAASIGSSTSTANVPSKKPAPANPVIKPRPVSTTAPPRLAVSNGTVVTREATHRMLVERLAGRDLDVATDSVREALRRFPEDPVVRAFEGLCYDLDESPDAAIRAYRAALYLDPSLFQVRLLLARCLEIKGMAERARREKREVSALLAASEATTLPGSEQLGLPTSNQAKAQVKS